MGRTLVPRYLAALELGTLADPKLHELAGKIATAAKTSTLVAGNATLTTTVAELATSDSSLTVSNQTVVADKTKLSTDLATEAQNRSLVVGALRTIVTVSTNIAKSPADLQGVGLPVAPPRPPRNQPPTVPTQINTKIPKTGHGKLTLSVEETGDSRYQYVAQQSLDGVTYTQLGVGQGKTRVVTGASGTKVWVRFAMVRGQLQSDWSIPAIVTIP
jgi:hypothetical protein